MAPVEEPLEDGKESNIYITRSLDATSHFETLVDDVHSVFERCMGKGLVLKKREEGAQVQE